MNKLFFSALLALSFAGPALAVDTQATLGISGGNLVLEPAGRGPTPVPLGGYNFTTGGWAPNIPASYVTNGMLANSSMTLAGVSTALGGTWDIPNSHVTNAMLVNSSMTLAGHVVSLGGAQTFACADLTTAVASCSVDATQSSNVAYNAGGTNPATQTVQDRNRREVLATDDSGVDPTGAADSVAGINRKLLNGNVKLTLPCGTYLLTAGPIVAYSNTEIVGMGACTIIKPSATFAPDTRVASAWGAPASSHYVFANNDFAAGNTDIHIHNLTVDLSSVTTQSFGSLMGAVSRVEIDHIRFIGTGTVNSQDATGFIAQSSNYKVHHNYAAGFTNACYDQWDGVSYVEITDNYCDGGAAINNGVLVNGQSSHQTAVPINRTSSHILIARNSIYNVSNASINVSGLCYLGSCGQISDANISENIINTTATGTGHGIFIGDGDGFHIAGNTITNMRGDGIHVASQIASGVTSNVTIHPGLIEGVGATAAGNGITIGSSADTPNRVVIEGGTIAGTTHVYPVRVYTGSTNVIVKKGAWAPGTSGSSLLGGTDTRLLAAPQFARTGSGFSKTSDTTLADVTGVSFNVEPGRTYRLSGSFLETQAATGGQKYALGGTATWAAIGVRVVINCNTTSATRLYTGGNLSTIGGTITEVGTGCTASNVSFDGTLVASTAGTLTIQFAQMTSDPGSSTITANASFQLVETP